MVLARGLVSSPLIHSKRHFKWLGTIVWNIGRSIAHKVLWPHWQFKRVMKNPAALFFIRLDRTKRV